MVATVQIPLTRNILEQFRADLLAKIKTNYSPNLILNFSGLDLMDRGEFEEIQSIVDMAYLMGVNSYFVGLSPEIASTLVLLDVNTANIQSALNLEDAFSTIEESQ